jgi:O-antigen/teichoic acid export membrane protein
MNSSFGQRFINGILHSSIGFTVQIILGLFGFVIAVRYISVNDIGIIVLIQLIAYLFGIVSTLLLDDIAVTRSISSSNEKSKVANVSITYKFIILLAISLCSIIIKPFLYYVFDDIKLFDYYNYVPLLIVIGGLEPLLYRIFQGYHKYLLMSVSQIISGVTRILFIILLVVYFQLGADGFLIAFILSYLASIFFQLAYLPMKYYIRFDIQLAKKLTQFGFPLGINNLLDFVFTKIDRFMIGSMISPIGVAAYEIAAKFPEMLRRIFESFRAVFFPNMSELFSQKKVVESQLVLNNSIRIVTFISILLTLFVTLFQTELVRLIFSEKYVASAQALSILTLSVSIGLIGNLLGTTLVAFGQSDKPAKINIVDALVNIIGNLILIPKYGIMGAVYATLISRCVTNPVNIYYLSKTKIVVSKINFIVPIMLYVNLIFLVRYFDIKSYTMYFFTIFVYILMSFIFSIIKYSDLVWMINLYRFSHKILISK